MSEPTCAQTAPYAVELESGKYWWCSCGKSKKQPFCDGSHQGSTFTPVEFTVEAKAKVWLCGCKKTKTPPYCDGTHNQILA
jgi:CDGSH iron-sulfur domain-containing protein 3